MAVLLSAQPCEGLGPEPFVLHGAIAPNGASNPVVSSNYGPPGLKALTATYAATGVFTLTLPADCTPVGNPVIVVSAQCESAAEWFEVCTIGAYNATTRQFVILAHRSGTGRQVPANAATRIAFTIHFNNSTGA